MKYRNLKKYKYQLYEHTSIITKLEGYCITTKFISLTKEGTLHIQNGYCWDGPSGPSIDTKTFMRASLFHDVGYQLIRMKKLPIDTKPIIDNLLRSIALEDGMCKFRAWYAFKAVNVFGNYSCVPGDIRIPEIQEAP